MNRQDVYEAKAVLADRLLSGTAASGTITRFATTALLTRRPEARGHPLKALPRAVHGVGVGMKIVQGEATRTLAVRLYVPVKLPSNAISREDRLPERVDGVPTDVVEAPPPAMMALPNRGTRRPLIGGISIGNDLIGAGTLACFCRSIRAGENGELIYLLSNNHVLAGNDTLAPPSPVYQPGRLDGTPPYGTVAHLARALPVVRGVAAQNEADAAIAQVVGGTSVNRTVLNVGRIAGIAKGAYGDLVQKAGRTTGVTHGRVDDEAVDEIVGIDPTDPSIVARYRNQLRLVRSPALAGQYDDGDSEFGRAGDSGSLVLTAEPKPRAVGLYFAGATGYGLANPIEAVLRLLEIELL